MSNTENHILVPETLEYCCSSDVERIIDEQTGKTKFRCAKCKKILERKVTGQRKSLLNE